jgi:SSS family solute:Na+ symporter
VARIAAVAGGATGVLLSIWLQTVIGALTVFYSLLVVTLFVPIIGGLYVTRARERDALAAVMAGVTTLFVVRTGMLGTLPWLDPTLAGVFAGAAAFAGAMMFRRTRA